MAGPGGLAGGGVGGVAGGGGSERGGVDRLRLYQEEAKQRYRDGRRSLQQARSELRQRAARLFQEASSLLPGGERGQGDWGRGVSALGQFYDVAVSADSSPDMADDSETQRALDGQLYRRPARSGGQTAAIAPDPADQLTTGGWGEGYGPTGGRGKGYGSTEGRGEGYHPTAWQGYSTDTLAGRRDELSRQLEMMRLGHASVASGGDRRDDETGGGVSGTRGGEWLPLAAASSSSQTGSDRARREDDQRRPSSQQVAHSSSATCVETCVNVARDNIQNILQNNAQQYRDK